MTQSIAQRLTRMTYRQWAAAGMVAIALIVAAKGWCLWCECEAVRRLKLAGVGLYCVPLPNVGLFQQVSPFRNLAEVTRVSGASFPPSMVVTEQHANDLAWLRSLHSVYLMPPLYPDKHGTPPSVLADESVRRLARLRHLTHLSVVRSRLTNDGLEHVGQLRNLTSLTVVSPFIDDDGLTHLRNLTKLRTLNISGTQINGPGLTVLTNFPHLSDLDLHSSPVNDEVLPLLVPLSNLKQLRLDGTAVSQLGRAEFLRQRPDFKRLDLYPNLLRAR